MNATATIDLQATAELVWERVVAWELQPLWMRDAADVHRIGDANDDVSTRVCRSPAEIGECGCRVKKIGIYIDPAPRRGCARR